MSLLLTMAALLLSVAPVVLGQSILFVDDDGAQCPGALKTIQEAVAKAKRGDTVLVCPGTYFKSVVVNGHTKDFIKLIAIGGQDEVVLQGDHTERDGFHLEEVNNVVLRGFTVREFGLGPTVRNKDGVLVTGIGNGIYLLNANYNVIESNRVTKVDMLGIDLVDSANNVVRYNTSTQNDAGGAACGMMLSGRKSASNFIFQNFSNDNGMSGLMLSSAGSGNVIVDNDFSNNGQWGIDHNDTEGTFIVGNRMSYNSGRRGEWANSAPLPVCVDNKCGLGIHIRGESTKVRLADNRLRGNSGFDIAWDGLGQIQFESNACDTATQAGVCDGQISVASADVVKRLTAPIPLEGIDLMSAHCLMLGMRME